MPRMISFSMTTPQFIAGTKDVTRRMGWLSLKVGDELIAVEKAMGLGKGGKVKRLGMIRVKSVRRERLDEMIAIPAYGYAEVDREGFPEMAPNGFVSFFCAGHKGCKPDSVVTRIEFEKSDTPTAREKPDVLQGID
jgi:hypothetical protein